MADLIVFIFGIILAIIGAAINNFGIVLQKRQVNIKAPPENPDKNIFDIKDFLKDPIFILGILMQTIIYLPFLISSMDILGVTLAQPLSNSGIIFLVIGLLYLLNEKLRKWEVFGTILMIISVITLAFGGVVGDITLNIFINSMDQFWIFMFIIAFGSIVSLLLILKIEKSRLALLGFLAGLCYSLVSISLQIFTLSITELHQTIALPLMISGMLGAIVGTIFGILSTQEAFKRGQAINIIPFSQISMNLIPIIAGILIFKQQILNPIFFWFGTIAIIISASLLARFQ
ncbi:MAG: hypothetical protein ACTSRG_14270 [Candidatus Helarchaeota archaeon]